MRLAILKDKKLEDGTDILLEYNESKVREKLKSLLDKYDFDTAWDMIVKELKIGTGKL